MPAAALRNLAAHFEPYLTLHSLHPTKLYNYKARGVFGRPVVQLTRHAPKCKAGESWVYVATPTSARLADLQKGEKLYIGAQTQDRMFRGDELDGDNFHHLEMRKGRGDDNLENYLKAGHQVAIYRISAGAILSVVRRISELVALRKLMEQSLPPRQHQAWWLEQYILHGELPDWRWNVDGANNSVSEFLGRRQ